jgi:hypothetical protein
VEALLSFVSQLWYSQSRKYIIAGAAGVVLLPLLFIFVLSGDKPAAVEAQPLVFAPLEKILDLPGAAVNETLYKPASESVVQDLASKLGVKDVKKSDGGWTGSGFVVDRDGLWTYKNPSSPDKLAEMGCVVGSYCSGPGVVMPAKAEALPAEADVLNLSRAVFSNSGLDAEVTSSVRDSWRVLVRVRFLFNSNDTGRIGEMVFGENSALLSASGVTGAFSKGDVLDLESSGIEYKRISTDGVLQPGAVPPEVGSTVVIASAYRTGVTATDESGTLRTTPAWAFEDAHGNVWTVKAQRTK